MRRLFFYLVLTAAGLGAYFTLTTGDAAQQGVNAALQTSPYAGYSGWAVGLAMGLALAWLARVQWSTVPERVGGWVRLQRRRLGWAALGAMFAAVLLLF